MKTSQNGWERKKLDGLQQSTECFQDQLIQETRENQNWQTVWKNCRNTKINRKVLKISCRLGKTNGIPNYCWLWRSSSRWRNQNCKHNWRLCGFMFSYKKVCAKGFNKKNPIKDFVAAISCGIVNEKILIDLDYDEDSALKSMQILFYPKNRVFRDSNIGEENTFNLNSVRRWLQTKNLWKIFLKFKKMQLSNKFCRGDKIVIASHNEGKLKNLKHFLQITTCR